MLPDILAPLAFGTEPIAAIVVTPPLLPELIAVTNPFPFTVIEGFVNVPTLLFTVASVSGKEGAVADEDEVPVASPVAVTVMG